MANYDLSKGVSESFTFTLKDPKDGKDLEYEVRYPSAADFEPSKDIDVEIDDLKSKMDDKTTLLSAKKEYQKRIDELEKKKSEVFYNLITPVGHDIKIEELIQRLPIKVMKNFNEMINKEFGV